MTKRLKKIVENPERLIHKEIALSSLDHFITYVHPKRCLGNIHRRIIREWYREDAKPHQMLLLPRDHMKSTLIAYRVVYELTKNPALKFLYISSTSNLATKQLKFIKDILTSDRYRLFWPDMVDKDEAKREKWTEREISVDHPLRKEESIRDPSIFTAGLTSNIVGLHCDVMVLDDTVVEGNAYTEEGRSKVKDQFSLLASIASAYSKIWVVGTRYHPLDLYADMMKMVKTIFDDEGNILDRVPLFEIIEEAVESIGDGSGEFLWPRQNRGDGQWFGFNREILEDKKTLYSNKLYFRAQYYNDPHDVDSSIFKREIFQYYEPSFLTRIDGRWFFKGERLNVLASIDFAYSVGAKADYTSIVTIGVDGHQNYYILDIDRFKTSKISEYFSHILAMFEKWGFRKIRAEVTAAQAVIVDDLKENYIRPLGLSLSIDDFRPSRWTGAKEERIMAVLQPKYENKQIWHYAGGNCQILEEELMFSNPVHDDVKDALASVIAFSVGQSPTNLFRMVKDKMSTFQFHSKFGGVS